jgi:hypothetical protein
MVDRTGRSYFMQTAAVLYRRGVKSHRLRRLSIALGESISTKTILANLRLSGVINPAKAQVGRWAKRHGCARWSGWGIHTWKNTGKDPLVARVAFAFAAWVNYARAFGTFDPVAVANGEKPP